MAMAESGSDGAAPVAGMDGCRGRWLCVWGRIQDPSALRAALLTHPAELDDLDPAPALVGVDIPIGLPARGPRACDRAARQRLGRPRGSSVFPAPLRIMLTADTFEQACAAGRAHAGRALSRQAWNILPSIRAMDDFLEQDPARPQRVREVHPELSFMLWNRGAPMAHNKKRPPGRRERIALVERDLPGALAAAERDLAGLRYARDDLLDAMAALWSAARIARGAAIRLPEAPETDDCGLPMVIRA